MNGLRILFVFSFCIASALSSSAQLNFTNSNNLLNNADFHSGVSMGVVDMNGDKLDDIVHLQDGKNLVLDLQNSDGTFTTVEVANASNENQWALCVGDLDNNGFNDVVTGGSYDDVKLFRANATGTEHPIELLTGTTLFVQGTNFVDINNDGWLDVFICNDDAASRIWINDGAGNLVYNEDYIDLNTIPSSNNSGNYGSIWTDFDNDGDTDLYIAKCRQGVNDPTDPRRINALYVNDGNNNYIEDAEPYGLKIGAQSWTADFQDIDNDGDYDCFITNHDAISQLLENDGTGHFTDITAGSGIDFSFTPIQGVMRDFDNDGFVDVLIAGGDEQLFKNNGDLTFTPMNLFDNNDMESFALGDLNNDGFIDIYGGYATIYTNPSNVDDVLWLNDGNENHFFGVDLIGIQSNKNGVGSRIEIYGPWGIQVREVRAGESYGIMNSFRQNFGLGTHTTVDSVIVKWPSGIIDIFEDLPADQFVTILEGNCISPAANLAVNGQTTICTGETVMISAPEGFGYAWSNGEITQSISIGEAGFYNVTISDGTGCWAVSQSVEVIVDPVEVYTITADAEPSLCQGSSITLSASGSNNDYTWSDGQVGQTVSMTTSGVYSYSTQGICSLAQSEEFEVNFYDIPEAPIGTGDVIPVPGPASISAEGGDEIGWYLTAEGGTPIATGNVLEIPNLQETTSFYAEATEDHSGPIANVGKETNAGSGGQNTPQFNGSLIFDVFETMVIKTVVVYATGSANRTVIVNDADGATIASKTLIVLDGENTLELDFVIPPGEDYVFTCQSDPSLYRNNNSQNISFPYDLDGIGEITNSAYGVEYYYYFYNWEIYKQGAVCVSDRTEVVAEIDFSINTVNIENAILEIYPNPAFDQVVISADQLPAGEIQVVLTNMAGQILKSTASNHNSSRDIFNEKIDLSSIPSGVYIIELQTKDKAYKKKLVVNK